MLGRNLKIDSMLSETDIFDETNSAGFCTEDSKYSLKIAYFSTRSTVDEVNEER